ncbi:MAG: HAD family hydrolase [Eubacteriales bacterium]|nr:HAD family hydrolase [Eubacteriales bacterium]
MKKVLCWDFDGTLVHSHSLWSGSIWRALKETIPDTNITLDDIEPYTSTGFPWYTPEKDYTALTGERWWDYMNENFRQAYLSLGVEEETAEAASKKVRDFIKKKENYHLYDDTVPVLEKVRQTGCRNIILSNNYPDLCEVLEKLKLKQYFDGFVISGQIGYDKPRQEIFEYAQSLFPDTDRYFMIGDSVKADILGGNRAGMTTILVHKPEHEAADYCFDTLLPVLNAVNEEGADRLD